MAWTFNAGAQNTTGSGTSSSVSVSPVAGEVVVGNVFINNPSGNNITSITDNATPSNSYTAVTGSLATAGGAGGWSTILFWSGGKLTNVGTSITVNSSQSQASLWITADRFTPPTGTLSVDVSSGNNGSGTATATTSLTTTANGDLVYAGIFVTGVGTLTVLSGFTQTETFSNEFASAFLSQTSSGSTSPGWNTPGGADTWTVSGFALKAVAAASGGLRRNTDLNGLGASGPFFHDPLATRSQIGWRPSLILPPRNRILRPSIKRLAA